MLLHCTHLSMCSSWTEYSGSEAMKCLCFLMNSTQCDTNTAATWTNQR